MTLSIFLVILSVYVIVFGYCRYKSYMDKKLFETKLEESENFVKMYKDYERFLQMYPDFQKQKTLIDNFMKGKK